MPWPRGLSLPDILLLALWAAALLRIFWPAPWLAAAGGAVLALYVVVAFAAIRRQLQILGILLGVTAAGLAAWLGAWGALWQGLERAVVFAAFFGTLALMRATADLRPEIARARTLVERLRPDERASGLLVGTNLLGAPLIVGVMAVFAPIVGHDAPYGVRKAAAEACQRGMCLAALWSPFWLAMAIATEHLPGVPLWQVMVLGLALSALGLVVAQLMYTPGVGLAGLGRAVRAFSPVLPPVGFAAAAVLLLNAATALSTLHCLVLAIPVLCLAALVVQGRDHLRAALTQARRGIGLVRGEIVLLTFAFALGRVLEEALRTGGIGEQVAALAPPPAAVLATIVLGMTALGLAGIHQVVTATVMLVLFGALPLGIAGVALIEAALMGWAFTSMTGLSAVSVAAASTMFRVPLERIAYGPNLRFCLMFGVIGVAALAAVNAWLA